MGAGLGSAVSSVSDSGARGSRFSYGLVRPHTFVSPSTDLRRADVSY